MKNSTIWETASRPLFVRTVWLEGSELRRGLQRHFLWDYDTKRSLEKLNSLQQNRTDNTQRFISLPLNDFTDFHDFNENGEEVFLLGSAKAKLHEPFKLNRNKKSKLFKYHRRSSLNNRQYPSYDGYNFAFKKDISQLQSRQNSLTQAQQIDETADVLLADRVLQWLDLAGKEDFLKDFNELKEMEVKLSKTFKLRREAIKRYNNKVQNNQKSKPQKVKNYERAAVAAATPTVNAQKNHKSSEPVKHITIIFNREGQPIRFNRPVKNIDLCTLSTSPSTTRRLAGSLASARLYKSTENPHCLNVPKRTFIKVKTGNEANKSISVPRRLDTVADLNNSTLQKRLQENNNPGSYSLHDSKKQLHIFMPTLLKRGFNKSLFGTEDGISELSHNFNELCRI